MNELSAQLRRRTEAEELETTAVAERERRKFGETLSASAHDKLRITGRYGGAGRADSRAAVARMAPVPGGRAVRLSGHLRRKLGADAVVAPRAGRLVGAGLNRIRRHIAQREQAREWDGPSR